MDLYTLALRFTKIVKQAQTSNEVQPGEIADDFPLYFPNKHQETSPLMNRLDVFLSKLLPQDINASIKFVVQPGFKPDSVIMFTKDGKQVNNDKWTQAIKNFLANEMKNFPTELMNKYKGRTVNEILTIATHII